MIHRRLSAPTGRRVCAAHAGDDSNPPGQSAQRRPVGVSIPTQCRDESHRSTRPGEPGQAAIKSGQSTPSRLRTAPNPSHCGPADPALGRTWARMPVRRFGVGRRSCTWTSRGPVMLCAARSRSRGVLQAATVQMYDLTCLCRLHAGESVILFDPPVRQDARRPGARRPRCPAGRQRPLREDQPHPRRPAGGHAVQTWGRLRELVHAQRADPRRLERVEHRGERSARIHLRTRTWARRSREQGAGSG